MNIANLNKHFRKIGTTIEDVVTPGRWGDASRAPFRLDIKMGKKREYFELRHRDDLTVIVRDVRPADRHLLMQVTAPEANQLFLCGHDERHYFSAGVPSTAKSVLDAMDSLQPPAVRLAALTLPKGERYTRHNEAFKRQGEWFFVLEPGFQPQANLILFNEPLRRGRSKPHVCQQVFRTGGTTVRFHSRHAPGGISWAEYDKLPEDKKRQVGWSTMQRDAVVYAKGKVAHPDHATLDLKQWHRVYVNQEVGLPADMMAFLD